MDHTHTEEQRLLADTVTEILARSGGEDRRRAVAVTDPGHRRAVWAELAAAGLTGLLVAEADGGSGAGAADAQTVAGALGRGGAGEPWVESAVIAAAVIADLGDDAQRAQLLGGLADGTALPILATDEPGRDLRTARPGTRAESGPDGWTVTGRKNPVVGAPAATALLVTADTDDGTGVFVIDPAVPGVTITGYRTFDDRRAGQIDLDAAPAVRLGTPGPQTAAAVTGALVRGRAAWAAEAVEVMARAVDLTVEYLRTREQFGGPLARFQALTHRAADMYVALELARSMSERATAAVASGDLSETTAARTVLQICRSARLIGQEAVQLHGGIGMTAEHPLADHVTRLPALEQQLGGADAALELLAGEISTEAAPPPASAG